MLGRLVGWNSPEQLSLMLIAGTRNLQQKQVKSGIMVKRWYPGDLWMACRPWRDAWGVKQPQEPQVSPLHGVIPWLHPLILAGPAQHGGEREANRSHTAQEGKHRDISQKWDEGLSWGWNAYSEWYSLHLLSADSKCSSCLYQLWESV